MKIQKAVFDKPLGDFASALVITVYNVEWTVPSQELDLKD
jgi:hypothetical protein